MKRVLFLILASFAAVTSFAADNLYLGDVTVAQGKSALVAINMTSEEKSYRGFQFMLTLPEGFEATEVVKADRTPDGFTLEVRKQSTIGKFQVLVYNTSGMSFNGTEGAVAYINITAAASTALGEYQGSIADVTMSTDQSFYFDESSFKITVTDKVVLDEVSAAPPVATEGPVDILVKRSIKANQWSTLCLPFDMTKAQVEEVFGSDVKIAFFDKESKPVTVTGNPVESIEVEFTSYDFASMDGMLYGCSPYLIRTSKDISEFEVTSEIYIDEEYLTVEYSAGSRPNKTYGFYGKLAAGTVIPENGLFLSGNEFWYSTGKTVMKGFRGYFQFTDVVPKSSSAKVTFNVDGEATSIDGMNIKYAVDGVYDLSGRKIQLKDGNLNKLQKGVYIIDGKKVTIK